jgi:hypothetical protein
MITNRRREAAGIASGGFLPLDVELDVILLGEKRHSQACGVLQVI